VSSLELVAVDDESQWGHLIAELSPDPVEHVRTKWVGRGTKRISARLTSAGYRAVDDIEDLEWRRTPFPECVVLRRQLPDDRRIDLGLRERTILGSLSRDVRLRGR
jgi:hypothetical protein